jgi:hypothetical protein
MKWTHELTSEGCIPFAAPRYEQMPGQAVFWSVTPKESRPQDPERTHAERREAARELVAQLASNDREGARDVDTPDPNDLESDSDSDAEIEDEMSGENEASIDHVFSRGTPPAPSGGPPKGEPRQHDRTIACTGPTNMGGRCCHPEHTGITSAGAHTTRSNATQSTHDACSVCYCDTPTPTPKGQRMDVVHSPEKLCFNAISSQITTSVSQGNARHFYDARPILDQRDVGTPKGSPVRAAADPRCDDASFDVCDLHGRTRSTTAISFAPDVVDFWPSRRHPRSATQGHNLQQQQSFDCELSPRESSSTARPVYCCDGTNYGIPPPTPFELQHPRRDNEDGTNLHDLTGGNVDHLSKGRSKNGSEVSTTRLTPMFGTGGHAKQHTDALFGTYRREDTSALSELGAARHTQHRSDDGGRRRIATETDLRLGGVPSWAVLTGRHYSASRLSSLPLHIKPHAIGTLDMDAVMRLPMTTEKKDALAHALRWVTPSWCYQLIHEQLSSIQRKPRVSLTSATLKTLFDVRKLVRDTVPPVAFCNANLREEEKEDGSRARPLFEPLINDIIKQDPRLVTTTRYTTRDETRCEVLRTRGGRQFDFAAWFDQIKLHAAIRKYFGVGVDCLPLIPMGYRPSCEVAEATTEAIADVQVPDVGTGYCVDNVLFTGEEDATELARQRFLARANSTGAVIKDPAGTFTTSYSFLGETYNHVEKTRALTTKTAAKCRYIVAILRYKRRFTLRQLAAIIGVLLFAADVLRITIGNYHFVMRYYATMVMQAKRNDATTLAQAYGQSICPPRDILKSISTWAAVGATNTPVDVWRVSEHRLTLYTDASATGWGAVSITTRGDLLEVGRQWTREEHATWNMFSSVAAEAVALWNAVCYFVANERQKVIVFTDHAPLVFISGKTFGKAFSYSWLMARLATFNLVEFEIRHVAGVINPADRLSRIPPTLSAVGETKPPILNVTGIGFMPIGGGTKGG